MLDRSQHQRTRGMQSPHELYDDVDIVGLDDLLRTERQRDVLGVGGTGTRRIADEGTDRRQARPQAGMNLQCVRAQDLSDATSHLAEPQETDAEICSSRHDAFLREFRVVVQGVYRRSERGYPGSRALPVTELRRELVGHQLHVELRSPSPMVDPRRLEHHQANSLGIGGFNRDGAGHIELVVARTVTSGRKCRPARCTGDQRW